MAKPKVRCKPPTNTRKLRFKLKTRALASTPYLTTIADQQTKLEKLLLESTLKSRKHRTLKRLRPILTCPRCNLPIPENCGNDLGTEVICTACFNDARGYSEGVKKTKRCARCLREKPLNATHYYRKVRGTGYMVVCRPCRDQQLRRQQRRICGTCWRIQTIFDFPEEQWLLPYQELAKCTDCKRNKRRKPLIAKPGEKTCPRCNTVKPVADYYTALSRQSSYCKECSLEYNKLRYSRAMSDGPNGNPANANEHQSPSRISKSIETLYALGHQYNEQELVDIWASGKAPNIDKAKKIPAESLERGTRKELSAFIRGFEKAVLTPKPQSQPPLPEVPIPHEDKTQREGRRKTQGETQNRKASGKLTIKLRQSANKPNPPTPKG